MGKVPKVNEPILSLNETKYAIYKEVHTILINRYTLATLLNLCIHMIQEGGCYSTSQYNMGRIL